MSYPPPSTVGPLTAADLDAYRNVGARKSADTTRISTATLAADPDLIIGVEANAVYWGATRLIVNSGATPDFKWSFTGPSGATMNDYTYLANVPATTAEFGSLPLISSVGAMGGDGVNRPLMLWFTLIVSSTAGNLSLTWAQNTSTASNTIVRAGSSLYLVRIG